MGIRVVPHYPSTPPSPYTITTMSAKNELDEKNSRPSVPAWKLREQMKKESKTKPTGLPPRKFNEINRTAQTRVDPNLPPAFKAVFTQRLAFARQQARRKNNDEFVSLNSSHLYSNHPEEDDDDSDLSSFDGDSFGEDDE